MTTTTNKGYTVPTVGADFGVWGTELNGNLGIQDNNLGGVATVSVAGNSDVIANASQAQCMLQNLTGVLTGSINYILPNAGSYYAVANNTTGNFNLFVKTLSGTGIFVPQGSSVWVYSNSTDIVRSTPSGWQQIAVYTVSGAASQPVYLPTIFRRFRLTTQAATVSSNGAGLTLQVSSDGGSTYKSSLYAWVSAGASSAGGGTVGGATNTSDTSISLSGGLLSPSTIPFDSTMEVFPGSSALQPTISQRIFDIASTSTFGISVIGGSWNGTAVLMNYLRILPSTGTFSGVLILEGMP